MKKTKLIIPSVGLALIAALGLTACGGGNKGGKSNGGSQQQSSSSVESLGEITITAEGNKTDLLVGETVKLTASVEGVSWKTRAPAVATVDENGVVTAVGAGTVKIRAEKDGYDTGSISITVSKAPEKEAHTTIGLEDADHYSPNDFWGMDLSSYGYGIIGPGDSPVENNQGKTPDSTSLGYLQAGCKETLTFTSNKAAEVEIGVTMAYNSEMNLASALSVKFNNSVIDMTGKVCEGPEDGDTNNYYDFHVVNFGKVNLVQGNNVLEIEMIAQAPNMDEFKLYSDDASLQIAVVKPAAKPSITVTPATVELLVGDTQQLTSDVAGVAYASSDATIASVSDAGLVTGLKQGQATITITKDGYKKATVTVQVTNKPVAGQIVLEAEDAIIPEGSTIQIENNASASGGKSLGYFSAGQTFTIEYTADAAKEYKLSIVAAACEMAADYSGIVDMDLGTNMSLKLGTTAIDLTGKTLPGNTSWNFSNFQEIDLGTVNIATGKNVFTFEALTQGPNIDCIKLTDPNAQGGQGGGEQVTKHTVSFNANGGSGEMKSEEVEEGEYTLPACTFAGPGTKVFAGWEITVMVEFWGNLYPQTQVKQPGEKITVSDDMEIKATWKVVITKDTQADLSSAFFLEAEDATPTVNGQQCVPEDNEGSHGGKDVGYMSAGAALTFNFNANAAGKVKLILMGRSASADWSAYPNVTYYDHALEETTSITVNGTNVSVAGKGFLGSDGKTSVQVDLGEVDVQAGPNTIVLTALAQAPNIDCFALISSSITFSLPNA